MLSSSCTRVREDRAGATNWTSLLLSSTQGFTTIRCSSFLAAVERARAEIARDPVDPAALQAAITEARRERQRFGPVLESLLIETVPRLSPEGRRALARFRGGALP